MDVAKLSPGKDVPRDINVVVEIPAGSGVKYEIDKESGALVVDRVVFTPMTYPAAYGFIPGTLDLKMVDRVEQVRDEDAIEMARRLAKEEGILSGISCGAAVVAAVKLAHEPAMKGKMIVVILPDSGERYLSSALVDGLD